MYQNLVREVHPDAHGSVHHCLWPEVDAAAQDESIVGQMVLARTVASLGLGARSAANIKVRQPLAKAYVHAGGWSGIMGPEVQEIVQDELNVKEIEFVEQEDALVSYRLVPDGRKLGPRLGSLFPKVRSALAGMDLPSVVQATRSGESVSLEVEGQEVEVAPTSLIVHGIARGAGGGLRPGHHRGDRRGDHAGTPRRGAGARSGPLRADPAQGRGL